MINRIERTPEPSLARPWLPTLFCVVSLLVGLLPAPAAAQRNSELKDVLEFRGYIRIGGEMQFSVFNKQNQLSEWLTVGQELGGYKIERFDTESNALLVRHNGEISALFLQASQIGRYIPPVPTERPDSAPPPRPGSGRDGTVSAPGANPSVPSLPSFQPSDSERAGSFPRDSAERPQQLSGLGSRTSPPNTPPPPSSGPPNGSPGGNDPGDNSPDDDDWLPTGSPPPLPPTLPPNYSPEEE